ELTDVELTFGQNGLGASDLSSMKLTYWIDPSPGVYIIGMSALTCPGPSGADIACALAEAPTETEWLSDNSYSLSLNSSGTFTGTPLDPDTPGSALQGSSWVDFCFGEDRTGTIEKTANNGFMIYETTSEGQPQGTVRVYDHDRKL